MKKGIWINEHTFVDFGGPAAPRRPLADEIATRSRSIDYHALGMYLPNPDPVLKKMGKDIETYTELRVDAHLGGCITSRKAGTMSLDWAIDRGKAKSRQARLVEDVFGQLDMDGVISEILDATLYGYSVLEVLWERQGQYVLPRAVVGKPQRWFVFDQENQLRFRTKENYTDGEAVPERKFLVVQHQASYTNPYGFPILSQCFWPVTFKKGGLKFWVVFTEKYGMPWLIGKHPRGAQQTEIDKLAATLENMVQDAVAAIPDDAAVEIHEAAGKSASAEIFNRLLAFCKSEISTALVGHEGAAQSTPGKLGGDNTAVLVRDDIVESDRKLVEKTMNQLIGWIYELNFTGEKPRFGMYAEEDVDGALAERDSKLAATGQVRFTKQYLQREYGFEDGDIEVGNFAPAIPAGAPPAAAPLFSEAVVSAAIEAAAQRPIDAATGALPAEELQRQAEGILAPVIKLINEGRDYSEIMTGLTQLFPKLNDAELQEMVQRAVFVSTVWGRLSNGK
jgi:phage gp29-like protein